MPTHSFPLELIVIFFLSSSFLLLCPIITIISSTIKINDLSNNSAPFVIFYLVPTMVLCSLLSIQMTMFEIFEDTQFTFWPRFINRFCVVWCDLNLNFNCFDFSFNNILIDKSTYFNKFLRTLMWTHSVLNQRRLTRVFAQLWKHDNVKESHCVCVKLRITCLVTREK